MVVRWTILSKLAEALDDGRHCERLLEQAVSIRGIPSRSHDIKRAVVHLAARFVDVQDHWRIPVNVSMNVIVGFRCQYLRVSPPNPLGP